MLVLECMSGGSLYDRLHNKTDDLPVSFSRIHAADACARAFGLGFCTRKKPK